ncbi:signal peptide peptidase domain-containing protein [Ditylenchus destructor]|nr:signal peptide peptidase domain-containing protein [Ditylenchus destructor]
MISFQMIRLIFAVIFLAFTSVNVSASKSPWRGYESSYAFLSIRTGVDEFKHHKFCVNFQQYRTRLLPAALEDAEPLRVNWWNEQFNQTDVCRHNSHEEQEFAGDEMVPALYQTNRRMTNCTGAPDDRIVSYQVSLLEDHNASNVLFLVEKGEANVHGIHDFLFSQFYNPEINETNHKAAVFYTYRRTFYEEMLPLLVSKSAQLFVYRPTMWFLDSSVFVLWLLAVSSISLGSAWMVCSLKNQQNRLKDNSSSRNYLQEDQEIQEEIVERPRGVTNPVAIIVDVIPENDQNATGAQSSPVSNDAIAPTETRQQSTASIGTNPISASNPRTKPKKLSDSEQLAQMSAGGHCCYVMVFVAFVVAVLLLSYFFRPYAVGFFNLFLVVLGTLSMHHIAYAIYTNFRVDYELFSLSQMCCVTGPNCVTLQQKIPLVNWLVKSKLFKTRIRLVSTMLLAGSFGVCMSWFFMREDPYSFFLLDFINVCLCVYAIKGTQVRSLRLLTFLLMAMFVYDIVMVFGTRLLTPSGCSVMLQVVTGMDCTIRRNSSDQSVGDLYPIPPIDVVSPEKIPIVFYVPLLNDPMSECFDVSIEGEFKHVMLGLGDVIVPGYLIAFCFFVDVVKRNKFYSYGLIALTGYSFGMIATFFALRLMETAQPALIYLVPFTLIPICVWSVYNKSFLQIWRGELPHDLM